jgi:hypothetical protein
MIMDNTQPQTEITLTAFQYLEKAGLYFLYCDIEEHRLTPLSRYGDKPNILPYYNAKGSILFNDQEHPIEIKNPVLIKLGPSTIEMNKIILNINKPGFDIALFETLKNAKIRLN